MTHTLQVLLGVFESGATALAGEGAGLLGVLVALEMTWAGIMWTFSGGDDVFRAFLRKVVHVGVFTFIVLNFAELANAVLDGFMWAGIEVGGGGLDVGIMRDPSAILDLGLMATANAWAMVAQTSLMDSGMMSVVLTALVSLVALFLYFVIAVQVFITLVEFYIVCAFGVIFIPWGVNRHTSFIAERYFGAIVAQGTKLMVLAALVAVLMPILEVMKLPEEPTWTQVLSLVFGVGTIAYVIKRAPEVASGLMSGSARLHGGDAMGMAVGLGAKAGSVVAAGAGMATGNPAAGAAAASGAQATASAAQSGLQSGAVQASGGDRTGKSVSLSK